MPTVYSRSADSATADTSVPRGFRTHRGERPVHTPRGGRSDRPDRKSLKKNFAHVPLKMPIRQVNLKSNVIPNALLFASLKSWENGQEWLLTKIVIGSFVILTLLVQENIYLIWCDIPIFGMKMDHFPSMSCLHMHELPKRFKLCSNTVIAFWRLFALMMSRIDFEIGWEHLNFLCLLLISFVIRIRPVAW